MTLTYVLDRDNRVVSIEGPWDEFARANGAPGLTRQRVIGALLLDFVTGSAARELVGRLFEIARMGPVRPLPFRCDSPSRRRFLRLELRAQPDSALRCDSILEREEERAFQPLLDPTSPRGAELVVVCSWCKKVRLEGGRWAEIDEAAAPLQLFSRPEMPAVSHGVCEPCAEAVRKASRPED